MRILMIIVLAVPAAWLVTCSGGAAMVAFAQMEPAALSAAAEGALVTLLPMFLLFVLACLRLVTWHKFWLLCLGWWLLLLIGDLAYCAYDPEGWQAEFEQIEQMLK